MRDTDDLPDMTELVLRIEVVISRSSAINALRSTVMDQWLIRRVDASVSPECLLAGLGRIARACDRWASARRFVQGGATLAESFIRASCVRIDCTL